MWVQATSDKDLVKGVRFQRWGIEGNLICEGVFIDNNRSWTCLVNYDRSLVGVGETTSHWDKNVDYEFYKIWKEMTTADYLTKIFTVLMRGWNDDRFCTNGVKSFIKEVLCDAIWADASVNDVKRSVLSYLQREYNVNDFKDVLKELEIEIPTVKVTVTFDSPVPFGITREDVREFLTEIADNVEFDIDVVGND